MPLSEKAKGKQRAIDPEDDDQDQKSPLEVSEVVVRFTEGIPDVTFALDPSYTIQEVKFLIREHRPTLHNRRLRIIVGGRLLTDEIHLHRWLLQHNHSQTTPTSNSSSRKSISSKNAAIIQCAVGAVIEPGEEVKDTSEQDLTQIRPLRGFDRLLQAGLPEDEIRILRDQFHAERGFGHDVENVLDIPPSTSVGETQDDYSEHVLNLEDAWLDSMQSDSFDDRPGEGDDGAEEGGTRENMQVKEIVEGLLLGFFFPLIPILFFMRPREPIFWDWDWEPERRRGDITPAGLSPAPQESEPSTPLVGEEASTSGSAAVPEGAAANVTQRRSTEPRETPNRNTSRSLSARGAFLEWRHFRHPRNVIFTTRTRMAILTGLGINILFGLCRFLVSSV